VNISTLCARFPSEVHFYSHSNPTATCPISRSGSLATCEVKSCQNADARVNCRTFS
jgi:hypothetical protein